MILGAITTYDKCETWLTVYCLLEETHEHVISDIVYELTGWLRQSGNFWIRSKKTRKDLRWYHFYSHSRYL